MKADFLPTSRTEMERLGWDSLDVIIVTADAYVDHPSFGAALIGRYLLGMGLRVGIIPQPDWSDARSFTVLGRPNLFFGVTAGNLDSMINLYTAQRKKRSEDLYSEGGQPDKRPYLPSIVYSQKIREAYKNILIVLGGIESSLRRVAHYDFYQDSLRQSILLDAKADLLIYGNAEKPLSLLIKRLKKGESPKEIIDLPGSVVSLGKNDLQSEEKISYLPDYAEVKSKPEQFIKMMRLILDHMNPYNGRILRQRYGDRVIQINPPPLPLTMQEMDHIYSSFFSRRAHPMYMNPIPALEVVETSITAHRGCYGGCHFCGLGLHQGKDIQIRSEESILGEVKRLVNEHHKQRISDIGGPTANMYGTGCGNKEARSLCKRVSCLVPAICKHLRLDHRAYLHLLRRVRNTNGIKQVSINSGIRTDLALTSPLFIEELASYYTAGRLSTAPEHCEQDILNLMGKPSIEKFEKFKKIFDQLSHSKGKKQFIVPYFIIGHPGSTEQSEMKIRDFIRKNRFKSDQIQEFYPTPMTISSIIYWTGKDYFTGNSIKVTKKLGEKKKWKYLIQNKI